MASWSASSTSRRSRPSPVHRDARACSMESRGTQRARSSTSPASTGRSSSSSASRCECRVVPEPVIAATLCPRQEASVRQKLSAALGEPSIAIAYGARMRTIIALLLATTAVSHAQPPEAAPQVTAAAKSSERVTVMWAPIRLVVPLVEITGELRVRDHIGAVLILGGGKRDLQIDDMTIPGTELEIGAQLRYYPLHAF